MVYLHPIVGALAVALICWVALHGLRSRHRASYAVHARRTHRRFAPWILGLCWLALVLGVGSTALLRDDLDVAASRHFAVAVVVVAAMTTLWIVSRRMHRAPRLRSVHRWIGLGTLGCALLLAVFGMSLLP